MTARSGSSNDDLFAFEGVRNFRDAGGLGANGSRVRRGWLYRSAHHADASPSDVEWVRRLGLAAIVDLRGPSERAQKPCLYPVPFEGRLFTATEETGRLLGPLIAEARSQPGGFDPRWLMRRGYGTMPFRWRLRRVLRNYFEALATTDGPVLVHCMAGKDRTGLAVALALQTLGVHRDDIIEDYLRTEDIGAQPLPANALGASPIAFGDDLSDDQLRELASVRAEYIEAALAAVVERLGSVADYLREVLDVPAQWIETIGGKGLA